MGIKQISILVLILAGAMTARYMGKQPVLTKSGPSVIAVSPAASKQSIVQLARYTVQDFSGSVLGTATSYASDIASKSAERVGTFVIDSSVGGIVKQVEKLPESQKKEIKEALCK